MEGLTGFDYRRATYRYGTLFQL